jgi:general transcription factor IIIA
VAIWDGTNACGKDFAAKVNLEDHIRTQHLGLPSVVNAKRVKAQGPSRKTRSQPSNDEDLEMINLLTGAGYGQDGTRNIPCLLLDCPWMFMRQYDLNIHIQSKHGLSPAIIENGTEATLTASGGFEPDDRRTLDKTYDQADLDWEMQNTVADSSAPFWIGAPDEGDVPEVDMWSQEEAEMRRLIDQDMRFPDFVDPALQGL